MARRRYLVMYDIRSEGRLRRVFQVVSGFGDRLQYSVYVCDLNPSELVRLRWDLDDEINPMEDSVAILDMGELSRQTTIGFTFLGVRPDLPDSGATII
ncbi:MAG: CRISPR-associated endonuclease Cas2 [Acidimicrobiales bacterium]|nr:CRISPR-associated endonuclease Cas2 [Acidimicrobiales bacterium]